MTEPVVAHGVAAPSVGRIVHWSTGRSGGCNAAMVAAVNADGTLNLGVWYYDGATGPRMKVPYTDPAYPAGEPDIEGWHWPERNAG